VVICVLLFEPFWFLHLILQLIFSKLQLVVLSLSSTPSAIEPITIADDFLFFAID
jgi:hypothetical protein